MRTETYPAGMDINLFNVIRKSSVSWLPGIMDENESRNFRSKISSLNESGDQIVEYHPRRLWTEIGEYYLSESKAVKLACKILLENLNQTPSTDLLSHIEAFDSKANDLINKEGTISDVAKTHKLVKSLNSQWHRKGMDFLDNGVLEYHKTCAKLRASYKTAVLMGNNQPNCHYSCDSIISSSRIRFRPKCTPSRCYGGDHHTPETCFKRPGNESLKTRWEEDLKRGGKWKQSLQPGVPSHCERPSFNNIEEVIAKSESIKLKNRDVAYKISVHGEYHCSNIPPFSAQNDKTLSFGLLDTGAIHHMLNNLDFFDDGAVQANKNPDAQLSLAGATPPSR